MRKIVSTVMIIAMLCSMFIVPAMATEAQSTAYIITPAEGAVVSDTSISATGTLPTGYTSAKLLVDGAEKAVIAAGGATFSQSIDLSSLNYGVHKLTLDVDGSKADRYFTLTGESTAINRAPNAMGQAALSQNHGHGWLTGWVNEANGTVATVVENGNTIGRTATKGKSGYIRLFFNNDRYESEPINTGIVKIETDFSVTAARTSLTIAVRDAGGGGGTYLSDSILGTAVDDDTKNIIADGTPYISGTTHHLTVIIDIDRQTRTIMVDDKILKNDEKLTRADVLTQVNHFYFELGSWASDNASLTLTNTNFTTIERYPYVTSINGNNKVADAKINAGETDVKIQLSHAVDAANVNATNVVLKKNGEKVESTVSSTDGKQIAIAPVGGFEAGAKYSVEMTGLTYTYKEDNSTATHTYAKPLIVDFDTETVFGIVSPAANEIYEQKDVSLVATVPSNYTDAKFYLDDKEITLTNDGEAYKHQIAYKDINFGTHTFKVLAKNEDDVAQEITKSFEITGYVSEVKEEYPVNNVNSWGATIASCQGADDSANGAYHITANNANAYFYLNSNEQSPITLGSKIVFDADIKRDSNRNIYLQPRGTRNDYSSGEYRGTLSADRNLVAADGVLNGTSIIVPPGEWHHYRIVTDLVAKTYEVYYDYTLVDSGTNTKSSLGTGIPDTVTFTDVQSWCPDNTAGIAVDNVTIRNYELNPKAIVESPVSAVSGEVVVSLDKNYDAVIADDVTLNGQAVKSVVFDADAKTITITPSVAFDKNTSYEIILSKDLTIGNNKVGKTTSVFFDTNNDVADSIGTVTTSDADGKLTASVSITKATNGTTLPDTAVLIIAVYNDKELVAVKSSEATTLTAGSTANLTAGFDNIPQGEIKTFIWTSLTDITPIK